MKIVHKIYKDELVELIDYNSKFYITNSEYKLVINKDNQTNICAVVEPHDEADYASISVFL